MKILAISGGNRDGNNDAMAKEALMGAKEAGAEIEFIRLHDLDLKPCTGCVGCVNGLMRGTNGDCVIRDDMMWLDEKLIEADGVIWAMPIFEKGVPAVMHIVQDRLFGPAHDTGVNRIAEKISAQMGKPGPDRRKFNKKVTSFIAIGGSEWSTRVSCDFNLAAMSPMWTVIDDAVFQWSKSIILNDAAIAKCHQIGVNIAKAAADMENAKYLGDPGLCANCHSRNFFVDAAGKAICEVCGIVGELKPVNGKMEFVFPPEQVEHAHNTLPGKFKHMDDMYRIETQFNADKKTPEYKARVERYRAFIKGSKPAKN